jgi:hypothetical protein
MFQSNERVASSSVTVESPSGAATHERKTLTQRFVDRLSVNWDYSRRLVSYQGNRSVPGLHWMK